MRVVHTGVAAVAAAAPIAVLLAVRGLPTAPNPVFLWWAGVALAGCGPAIWLLLRFVPPRRRVWRPAFAVSALFVGLYAAVFPAAVFVLFFGPQYTAGWLVSAVLGLVGAVRLHRGQIQGAWLAAAPVAVLGTLGATAGGAFARSGWIPLAGWAALDAGAVMLLLALRAARTAGTRPEAPTPAQARGSV
jgi:hypothetical protein